MLNRWKNKEKATGPGSSNTLPSKGSAKKKRKTGREGGKTYHNEYVLHYDIKHIFICSETYLFQNAKLMFLTK